MQYVGRVFVLIGCLVLSFLLSYAEGFLLQDAQVERNTVSLNPNQRIAQVGKSATVVLIVNAADGAIGNGSGFFIRQNWVVTNAHVLAGIYGEPYTWELRSVNQPTRYAIKGVVASDPEHDLVILRVEGKAAGVLELGGRAKLGEKVIAGAVIGICVEGGETKSSGYVIPSSRLKALLENRSAQEKSLEEWRAEPMIRAYALANRGDAEKVLGSAKGAIAAYDAAIRLTPDFAAAYAKRGSVKYNLGDYKGTIKDYDAAPHGRH